jgi:PAS domain S-box-containing protein
MTSPLDAGAFQLQHRTTLADIAQSPLTDCANVLYPFAIYLAVTLLTGLALILLWRQDRSQSFSALLGLSHMVSAMTPLAYLAVKQPERLWHVFGLLAMVALGSTYLTLLVMGFARLSGRRLKWRKVLAVMGGFVALHLTLIACGEHWAQLAYAYLNTSTGLVVAWWLRKQGPGERASGVFIVMCGLNQFTYVLLGDAGVPLQASIGAVLRLLLGLSLMYAALSRTGAAVTRMRDRFFELTDRSPQGVAVVARGGAVVYVNPAFERIYGQAQAGRQCTPLSPEWVAATVPEAERHLAMDMTLGVVNGSQALAEWSGERLSLDGRHLHLHFRAWLVEWDGERALQMVVTDDTARVDADRALLWRATHDELTGLPNRSALLQRLRELFGQPLRPSFALIQLDVDRFKLFNEAHGQAVGDEVLKALSAALRQRFAARVDVGVDDVGADVAAEVGANGDEPARAAEVMRLGEDEFALLVIDDDPTGAAEQTTQAIKALLCEALVLPSHRFFLDVSMGVAVYPCSADTAEALLQAANAAMHEAKALPGSSVSWAQKDGSRGLVDVFSAEQALRAGLSNDEFQLRYQPKVAATSGSLTGFEALVRWDRPGLGIVSPQDFIPAAERNGLIVPLGALILDKACAQMAAWRALGLRVVPVAVNVSPLQLLDAHFPQAVMATLQRHGVPPAWLTLEITESAAVTHMGQAHEQIQQLRQHGVEVALDDFGTGFSSLNMLRSLPLRTVKIDRSLIDPMPGQEADAVVRAICDLAAVLGLNVVAEGVETTAHATAALQAGCDVLQGYLFAKPLDVDEATRWLSERY